MYYNYNTPGLQYFSPNNRLQLVNKITSVHVEVHVDVADRSIVSLLRFSRAVKGGRDVEHVHGWTADGPGETAGGRRARK